MRKQITNTIDSHEGEVHIAILSLTQIPQSSDSEKSYADITRILMAQLDQPTQGQTSHTEPFCFAKWTFPMGCPWLRHV